MSIKMSSWSLLSSKKCHHFTKLSGSFHNNLFCTSIAYNDRNDTCTLMLSREDGKASRKHLPHMFRERKKARWGPSLKQMAGSVVSWNPAQIALSTAPLSSFPENQQKT